MAGKTGRRVNLADLADDPPLPGARVPAFAEAVPRSPRIEQVAANPLNTRDVEAQQDKIDKLADSIRAHGQLEDSTVVTRDAFLAIFPEHASDVADASFVQVTGGRRRAALLQLGLPTIDIAVKNSAAASRAAFISATVAENIDREDYDPIEEARAVRALVEEVGSGKAAAEQLSRTPAWVTQRLNLLKLEAELHTALRASEIPLREVRDLHKRTREEQLTALATWKALSHKRNRDDERRQHGYENPAAESDPGEEKTATPRRSTFAAALRRLGGTPLKIAEALRTEMSREDRRALAEELLREE